LLPGGVRPSCGASWTANRHPVALTLHGLGARDSDHYFCLGRCLACNGHSYANYGRSTSRPAPGPGVRRSARSRHRQGQRVRQSNGRSATRHPTPSEMTTRISRSHISPSSAMSGHALGGLVARLLDERRYGPVIRAVVHPPGSCGDRARARRTNPLRAMPTAEGTAIDWAQYVSSGSGRWCARGTANGWDEEDLSPGGSASNQMWAAQYWHFNSPRKPGAHQAGGLGARWAFGPAGRDGGARRATSVAERS